MQINCKGDYAAAQVRNVLQSHGLKEGDGYTKSGPFIGQPDIIYSISGAVPVKLKTQLVAIEGVTVEDD